ncbi:DUF2868 domain-containing protein [Puniceicoccales bacterium CK1056]|uniref:DUF2868 domain-containing protein n=1 Tax=Oceanipulchritudo coccoides TaxID=2706888 RepID=A0A6B2M2G2_9BACT|nr:DUF2868 domain-containing protein [Oceanipulchritudo coccoides]NDV62933.1 DUF2868 domain-containing protein [Oceanipulchritudo coccoides]
MLFGRKTVDKDWGLADVLRLEVLAYRHEQARLSGRERMENAANQGILEEMQQRHGDIHEWQRRRLLRQWMESKWAGVHGDNSGNDLLESVQKTGRMVLWGGFILGLLVHSFWSQLGNSVNVMGVFLTHVILPLLFLAALCVQFIPGIASSAISRPQRLWHPVVMLFLGLSRRFAESWETGVREAIPIAEVLKFVLLRRGRIIATWFSMLIQRGVLAYLAGFWIWFVIQLLTRSAAFTWGTTLSSVVSAERVSRAAYWIGLPWRWVFSGPSEEQIAATQSWFGQPVPLVQSGWEAWALFLMLAILVYAILPRLVVLVLEGTRLRWLVSKEDFSALRFTRILDGMLLRTGIDQDSPDPSEFNSEPTMAPHMPEKSRKQRDHDVGLIVSLESIIQGREDDLSERLRERFQLADCRWIRLGQSAEGREQLRGRIQESTKDWLPFDHADRVLHIVDSGQNPKQAYRSRLALIREIIGPQAGVVFILTGSSQNSLQDREKIWLKSIRRWGDFNTDVVSMLAGNEPDTKAEEAP